MCKKAVVIFFLPSHSVEITEISCHLVFTWNQSRRIYSLKICNFEFWHNQGLWNLIFVNSWTFWWLKNTKLAKFRALKMSKTSFLELIDSPKLISRKIWVMEKLQNFHTVWALHLVLLTCNGYKKQKKTWEVEVAVLTTYMEEKFFPFRSKEPTCRRLEVAYVLRKNVYSLFPDPRLENAAVSSCLKLPWK